jgi:hypothetical protein
MDFENMSLDELKKHAKSKGMTFGNISKEKLIAKLNETEKINKVLEDDTDIVADEPVADVQTENIKSTESVLDTITKAIDEVAETKEEVEAVEELPNDTVIRVRSITFGTTIYKSPITGSEFIWNKMGDVQDMTIGELRTMNNSYSDFLNKPMLILLDDRAIRQFRLSKLYESVSSIYDLKTLFTKDISTIEGVITKALEANMRDMLISRVRMMYKNGSLKDINVIRLLEDKLQFDILRDI